MRRSVPGWFIPVLIILAVGTTAIYHLTQQDDINYYTAHRYFVQGKYRQAIPRYERTIALNPRRLDALTELAYASQWTGAHKKAIDYFKKILAITPADTKIKFSLAETLSWEKQYAAAMTLFKEVIAATGTVDAKEHLAYVYLWTKQFPLAKAEAEGILRQDPENISAKLIIAKGLSYAGEAPQAIALYEEILKTEARPERTPEMDKKAAAEKVAERKEVKELLSEAYMVDKQYEKAVSGYQDVLKENPKDVRARVGLADILSWEKRYDESMREYRQALACDPGNLEIMEKIAQVSMWKGDFPAAVAAYREILKIAPDRLSAVVSLGEILSWQKEYPEAISLLEMALRKKRDERTLMLYSEVLSHMKEYPQAIEMYSEVLTMDPANAKAKQGLAEIYSWTKQYDKSIALYREVIGKRDDPAVKRRLAEVYLWAGNFRKSQELMESYLRDNPQDFKAQFLLAKVKHFSGDMKGALQLYEGLLKEEDIGSREEFCGLISEAYKNTGHYDAAVKCCREILKENPQNVTARASLAEVLSWTGKQDEAIAEYERVLKIDPVNNGVKIKLGQLYSWHKDFKKAENLFREVLQSDPNRAEGYCLLGEVLLWNKKYDEALGWIAKGRAVSDSEHLRLLEGQTYLYKGDYAKAKEILKKVIDADSKNVKARMYYADAFAYDRDFKKAIDLYRAILKEGEKPGTVGAPNAGAAPRSRLYFQKEKETVWCMAPESELEDLLAAQRAAQATGVFPSSPQKDEYREVKEKLADVLSWDKQYKESIALYDELIGEKEDPKLRLQKARVLGWAREYSKSIAAYRQLYDMYHDPKVKLEMEGKEYYWEGRVERAIRTYNQLIEEDQENVEAMFDLSQIYSYQAMWRDARSEYDRILSIEPTHFRAKEGLSKARLISQHVSFRTQYEFYEADSSSRSDDIRRNHFFNEVMYPYDDHLTIYGGQKTGWRQFSDYGNLIENEGRVKLAYRNNPQWSVDGFYDLIHYNKSVPNMHTFGEGLTMRTFDSGHFRFSHERQRLENNSTVIRQNYFSDNFTERWETDVTKRLKVGADYLFGNYSDCNYKHEPGADITYYISLDPKRLAVTYRYFYRNFDETVNEYWSPKGYNNNLWSVNWRHFLNKEEIFFGANDLYYDFRYDVSLDSQGVVSHRFEAGFYWDITRRLNVNVKAATTNTSANVYTDKGVTAEVKYYF